jgi:hypothetical protein
MFVIRKRLYAHPIESIIVADLLLSLYGGGPLRVNETSVALPSSLTSIYGTAKNVWSQTSISDVPSRFSVSLTTE